MNIVEISRSLVAVRSHIPDEAFTAEALGTTREGSGVVIRDSGLVLTIGYLITEANEVWLTTHDGRIVPGHAMAYDQETGFGLVRPWGRSICLLCRSGIRRSWLWGQGRARRWHGGFVQALIVAKQEFAGYWEYLLDEAIFTAPAHPSWGGAALVDQDSRVVGIGSLRLEMSRNGESAEINMVVPINLLKPILDDLLRRGQANRPPRPWLGVFSAENNGEVVVMSVAEGGPADKAGLQRGDIISDVRDSGVDGLADFYRKVWSSGPAGSELPMRIVRDGRETWLRIKSADRNTFLHKPPLQ